jgi:hypothetical protein
MVEKLSVQDVLDIQDLVARYAYYTDERDFDALADLLAHADFYAQGTLVASKDAARIRHIFAAFPRAEAVQRRHITTNVIVQSSGPDTAAASSCFIWTEVTAGEAPRILQCGVYRDRFENVGGAWRFVERRAISDGLPQAAVAS